MVHGYHIIMPVYGFWLPNDPRGSWSDTVRKWELTRFGPPPKSLERKPLEDLTPQEKVTRDSARAALQYPPVTLTHEQTAGVGRGFGLKVALSNYTVWACSILPEHTHLVIARHTFEAEKMANQLKGSATRQLLDENCHPLAGYKKPNQRLPHMWAEHQWIVFLDSEEAIDQAILYVEENPVKERKPRQTWDFVTPFAGLPVGGWVTYH